MEDQVYAVRRAAGCVVVAVTGVLDLVTAPAVRLALEQELDAGARQLVLDLTGVRFLDSTALGMLVWLRSELLGRGGAVALATTAPIVLKVLRLASMDQLIPIFDRVEAAEEAVTR
ncbi:MAG: STAS domain-containing protein [Catenulispora sp.]|nr:STAS domain-containing protein [Catenulispora sp.]